MLVTPRDYQEYAIARPFEYFEQNTGNPLILMPTGTGKSIVVGGICERALKDWPATRIIMMTETKELVWQNYEKLKQIWPEAPVGIYCDGLDRKQLHYPITFGTIGSLIGVAERCGFIDFVIVDEAHRISQNDDTMYRKFLSTLMRVNSALKVIGLTATGFRMKQGMLTEGENALFTDIIVDMTDIEAFNWFFDEGYLVPPVPRPTRTEFDISNVKIRGGEYDQKSMQETMDDQKKNEAAVIELLQYGQSRHSGMVFASGLEHCKHLLEIFEYYGERATWVASKGMSDKERDYNIRAFKEGESKWMINNGILTTGFDHPLLDIIGILRLMLSPGLWVQILGRGTRPVYCSGFDLSTRVGRLSSIAASQKQNCLALDFAQNATRLGVINAPRIPKPPERKRAGDAPVRICESCGCYNHASARTCWSCGFEFPRYLKIDETAGTHALVRSVNSPVPPVQAPKVEEVAVDRVAYQLWKKQGKPDSIKVTYHCGRRQFSEWVCLEHEKISGRARNWWRKFAGTKDAPSTTAAALAQVHMLRQPRAIEVAITMEWADVRQHIFE